MASSGIVKQSIYWSLLTQLLVLIIGVYALFIPLKKEDQILNSVLLMENIVQFIEFSFYVWFGLFVYNLDKLDIAKYRYYDWVFTTPIMLFTMMIYFKYNTQKENQTEQNQTEPLTLTNFTSDNKIQLLLVFLSNLVMLIVGYLQEIGKMSIITSSIIGFIALFYSFYIIYQYVGDIYYNKVLFGIMFLLWNFYGIAALFKNKIKNTMYNILDLLAKNFFGLFIAYQIIKINNN